MKFIIETVPKQQELRSVIELLTLAKDVQTKTTMDDFPGHFVCLTQQIPRVDLNSKSNSQNSSAKTSLVCFSN